MEPPRCPKCDMSRYVSTGGADAFFCTLCKCLFDEDPDGANTMAGDWIKMRHDLHDDPAVIMLVQETSCVDSDHVVGLLHKLWCWADRQTQNGRASGVTYAWMDHYLGVESFCKTLEKAGWLRVTGRDIIFPRFNRHMSKSAKKRALAAIRQARARSRKSHATDVTKAQPEKRREEKSLSSTIDRSIERDIESIDWEEADARAAEAWNAIRGDRRLSPALREKLTKAAAVVVAGVLPQHWLNNVLAKFRESQPKKPVPWLGTVLASDAKELGVDFDAYQRAITVPKKGGEA